ncbi:MAG: lysylphosphatidylglycerol synthase transmembrane domain-containing protein [bacterium]|nr:lysylphosphatidylglycerol synthase transmembrane domain-containing protein [bacterium]
MSPKLKTFLKLALSLGLALFFFYLAFQNVEWHPLRQAIWQANPAWLLVGILIIHLSNLPRAWRWLILLAPISKKITLWQAVKAVIIGYAGNSIFPRAGEVARLVPIKQAHDLSLSALLATVVIERALDLVAFFLLFGVVLLISRDKIARVFPGLEYISLLTLIGLVALLILLIILSIYGTRALPPIERLLGRFSRPLATRFVNLLQNFLLGIRSVQSVSAYLGIFFSTVLLNLCYLMSVYASLFAFQFQEIHRLGVLDALVVLIIGTIGVIIPTPGGTGTYHFFCTQALTQFFGVQKTEAAAFATVMHGLTMLSFLILGGPGLIRLFWARKSPKNLSDT